MITRGQIADGWRPGSCSALLLLGFATATTAGAALADPAVRARPQPELPWVVAVIAVADDAERAALAAHVAGGTAGALARPLVDAGGSVRVEGELVVVQGPPDADALVLSTARALAASRKSAALFVDGRTRAVDAGALPARAARPAPPSVASAPQAGGGQPLAPSPSLLDVEGEALAIFVEQAAGGGRVELRATREGATLAVVDVADAAAARAALTAAVAAPLSPRAVEIVRAKARGRIAERRARAGGWSRDMARLWLAFGTLDVEEPVELGARLRARVFPEVLFRSLAR